MPFYLLLLTHNLLCVVDNNNLPTVFKDHIQEVIVFDDLSEIWSHLSIHMTYDDLWDFGLKSIRDIRLGEVYTRISSIAR